MIVGMAVKVGIVALGAGSSCAAVNRGVTIAVNTNPTGSIVRVVAGAAGGMDGSSDVSGMAGYTECCFSY